jgi:hypothetical protein
MGFKEKELKLSPLQLDQEQPDSMQLSAEHEKPPVSETVSKRALKQSLYVLFVLLIFGVFGNLIYISFSVDPFGINKTLLASQQHLLACNDLVDSMESKF